MGGPAYQGGAPAGRGVSWGSAGREPQEDRAPLERYRGQTNKISFATTVEVLYYGHLPVKAIFLGPMLSIQIFEK